MGIEKPTDWSPLPVDYGGVDLIEHYSQMLVESIMPTLCEYRNYDHPIAEKKDWISAELRRVEGDLQAAGKFYYGSRSVFGDFIIMLNEAFTQLGKEKGYQDPERALVVGYEEIVGRFNQNMTTEEALQLARTIVATWNWD